MFYFKFNPLYIQIKSTLQQLSKLREFSCIAGSAQQLKTRHDHEAIPQARTQALPVGTFPTGHIRCSDTPCIHSHPCSHSGNLLGNRNSVEIYKKQSFYDVRTYLENQQRESRIGKAGIRRESHINKLVSVCFAGRVPAYLQNVFYKRHKDNHNYETRNRSLLYKSL